MMLITRPKEVHRFADRSKCVRGEPGAAFRTVGPHHTSIEHNYVAQAKILPEAALREANSETMQPNVDDLKRENMALQAKLEQQNHMILRLQAYWEEVISDASRKTGKLAPGLVIAKFENGRSESVAADPRQAHRNVESMSLQDPAQFLQDVIQGPETPYINLGATQDYLCAALHVANAKNQEQNQIMADLINRNAMQQSHLRIVMDRLAELEESSAEQDYLLTVAEGIGRFRSKVASGLGLKSWVSLKERLEDRSTWGLEEQIAELMVDNGMDYTTWHHLEEIHSIRNHRCHPVGRGVPAQAFYDYAVAQQPPPGLGINRDLLIRALHWSALEEGRNFPQSPKTNFTHPLEHQSQEVLATG